MDRYFFCSFESSICLASTPAKALIRTSIYCLTSAIKLMSKNWSPPANNGSCLGLDLLIIYTLLKPWSGNVQLFALGVSIEFFTQVSKRSTTISFCCEMREWHFCMQQSRHQGAQTKDKRTIRSKSQISLTRFQGFRYYRGYNRFKTEVQILVENSVLQLRP